MVVAPLVALLCYLGLLILTVRKGLKPPARRAFALYLTAMAIWAFGAVLVRADIPWGSTLQRLKVMHIGGYCFSATFYHFVVTFLSLKRQRRYIPLAYLCSFLSLGANWTIWPTVRTAFLQPDGRLTYTLALDLPLVAQLLCNSFWIVLALINLILAHQRSRDPILRNRIAYCLLVIALTLIGLYGNFSVAIGQYGFDHALNVISALLLGYVIFRYRLLDIQVAVRRAVLALILAMLVSAIFLLLAFFMYTMLHITLAGSYLLAMLLVSMGIGLSLVHRRLGDALRGWVGRLLLGRRYRAYRALQDLVGRMAAITDWKELKTTIEATVAQAMEAQVVELVVVGERGETPEALPVDSAPQAVTRDEAEWLWPQLMDAEPMASGEVFMPIETGHGSYILIIGPKARGHRYSVEDLGLLSALAGPAALALENARLEMERRQASQRLISQLKREVDSLQALTDLVSKATEPDSVMVEMLDFALKVTPYECGAIYLLDEATGELMLAASQGMSEEFRSLKPQAPLARQCAEWLKAPAALEATELLPSGQTGMPGHEVTLLIGAPLGPAAAPLGLLLLASHTAQEATTHEVDFVAAIGRLLGMALRNARLMSQARRQAEQLRRLYETSLDITGRIYASDLFEAIVRRSVQLLGAKGGGLTRLDRERGELELLAAYHVGGSSGDLVGYRFKVDEEITGRVMRTGQPVIVDDCHAWIKGVPDLVLPEKGAMLQVPLLWQDRVIGVLGVGDDPSRRFDEEDVRLLSLFAAQAAIAMKVAEAHAQAEELAILEERNRIACEIHDGLLQYLASIMYKADLCLDLMEEDAAEARVTLEEISQALQACIRETRWLVSALRPDSVRIRGLLPVLRQRLAEFKERTGLAPQLYCIGDPGRLPEQLCLILLRVVQETLNNVYKHAQADRVSIHLDFSSPEEVQLCVQDDGRGFDLEEERRRARERGAFGLCTMRERVESVGGSLRIETGPGQGTRVEVRLPKEIGRRRTGKEGDVQDEEDTRSVSR